MLYKSCSFASHNLHINCFPVSVSISYWLTFGPNCFYIRMDAGHYNYLRFINHLWLGVRWLEKTSRSEYLFRYMLADYCSLFHLPLTHSDSYKLMYKQCLSQYSSVCQQRVRWVEDRHRIDHLQFDWLIDWQTYFEYLVCLTRSVRNWFDKKSSKWGNINTAGSVLRNWILVIIFNGFSHSVVALSVRI